MPAPNTREAILNRIEVDSTTGCWEYPAPDNGHGYKQVRFRGPLFTLHRLIYEWLREPIPEGLVLDHLCRNRGCCNPDHLEVVTFTENVRRGDHAKPQRTHCVNGHELTEDNRYMRYKKTGAPDGSQCLRCRREAALRSYYRRRG